MAVAPAPARSISAKCLPTWRRVVPWIRVSATVSSQSSRKVFLRLQTGEVSRLEGIALDVVNALFDLPLVPRRARSCGPEENAVVLAEGADLRVELRIEPVGLCHGGLEVIQDQPSRCSTEVTNGRFRCSEGNRRWSGDRRPRCKPCESETTRCGRHGSCGACRQV